MRVLGVFLQILAVLFGLLTIPVLMRFGTRIVAFGDMSPQNIVVVAIFGGLFALCVGVWFGGSALRKKYIKR